METKHSTKICAQNYLVEREPATRFISNFSDCFCRVSSFILVVVADSLDPNSLRYRYCVHWAADCWMFFAYYVIKDYFIL